MAAEQPVIEDQIDAVMPAAFGNAELAGLETKAAAELQQEFLEVVEKDGFEIELGVFRALGKAGEFENVGIAQDIGNALPGLLCSSPPDDGFLIRREAGALVEQGAYLPLELADRPASLDTFAFVEGPLPRIVEPDEFLKMRPGEAHQVLQGKRSGQFAGRRPANSFAGYG